MSILGVRFRAHAFLVIWTPEKEFPSIHSMYRHIYIYMYIYTYVCIHTVKTRMCDHKKPPILFAGTSYLDPEPPPSPTSLTPPQVKAEHECPQEPRELNNTNFLTTPLFENLTLNPKPKICPRHDALGGPRVRLGGWCLSLARLGFEGLRVRFEVYRYGLLDLKGTLIYPQ